MESGPSCRPPLAPCSSPTSSASTSRRLAAIPRSTPSRHLRRCVLRCLCVTNLLPCTQLHMAMRPPAMQLHGEPFQPQATFPEGDVRHPDLAPLPMQDLTRFLIDQWIDWSNSIDYVYAGWLTFLIGSRPSAEAEGSIPAAQARFETLLGALDAHVQGRTWLVGSSLTLAVRLGRVTIVPLSLTPPHQEGLSLPLMWPVFLPNISSSSCLPPGRRCRHVAAPLVAGADGRGVPHEVPQRHAPPAVGV